MARFPYSSAFEPVVSRGDYLEVLTPESHAYDGQIFKVDQVEPIQPFLLDFLLISGVGTTPLAANGGQSNQLPPATMRNYWETDNNILAQWRVDLVDDFFLQLGNPGNAQFGQVAGGVSTFISSRLPRHTVRVRLTTAPATDTLLWTNTNGAIVGGRALSQTPTRKSRLIGLAIYVTAATTVYFGDAAAAGGTAAGNVSKLFGIPFLSNDFIFLSSEQLPKGLRFESGIVFQQTAAVDITITAVVEESNTGIFDGQLDERERAKATHNNEFYSIATRVPSVIVYNPLAVTLATALAEFSGYQISLDPVDKAPVGVKVTGIPLEQIKHSGTVGATD